MSIAYGAIVGFDSCKGAKFALKWEWIGNESYLLFPTALGLFTVGTCGAIGIDDLLAFNSCVDVLLNLRGFMYIGAILPWDSFNDPSGTGITWGRLIGIGLLEFIFHRLRAIFTFYKMMPGVCTNWKEVCFMGYFGPIGAGTVFYVEHARHLFPHDGEGDEEETNLVRDMGPTVYWLVLFSIIVHGLSIPALNIFYHYTGNEAIREDPVELRRVSLRVATPPIAVAGDKDTFIAYNCFSRHFDPNRVNLPFNGPREDNSSFLDDDDSGKIRMVEQSKPGMSFV
ncbi:plasma membrane antiporter [Fusarium beomiforme]|uniref:Plasma membrane antiporter n=1 Tax=Fusarium beomiforme TaxID=44412 RepID=A0A9P5AQP5_9HYPO|nr:plasma membrane antiporter [Fusarium beomiforme]